MLAVSNPKYFGWHVLIGNFSVATAIWRPIIPNGSFFLCTIAEEMCCHLFLSCLMARHMVLLSSVVFRWGGGIMHPHDCVFSQWKLDGSMQPCVFVHFLFFWGLWHIIEQCRMCSSLVPILDCSGINNLRDTNNLRGFLHWYFSTIASVNLPRQNGLAPWHQWSLWFLCRHAIVVWLLYKPMN